MARYELLERIGAGGMAEIFRGTAVAGGGFEKPVAIKRILPHLSLDDRFVAMLIAEAQTLARLRHRNIVQIYDVGLGDDGQHFLVMEYVDGTDLGTVFEWLERHGMTMPLEVALFLGQEICDALAHAAQVVGADGAPLALVHRDISPSNILVSRSGEIKLTDFGLAKRAEEVTGHGVRGKFAYMSPEQSEGAAIDARSDVFSLGIVLYELITGTRLFSHLPATDALQAMRAGNIAPPSSKVPTAAGELDGIVLRALAKDPDERFPTAAEFGAALRDFRYSLSAAAGDPTSNLASCVAKSVEEKAYAPAPNEFDGDEPTVLRIVTAAGFSPNDFRDGANGSGAGVVGAPMDAANTRAQTTEYEGESPPAEDTLMEHGTSSAGADSETLLEDADVVNPFDETEAAPIASAAALVANAEPKAEVPRAPAKPLSAPTEVPVLASEAPSSGAHVAAAAPASLPDAADDFSDLAPPSYPELVRPGDSAEGEGPWLGPRATAGIALVGMLAALAVVLFRTRVEPPVEPEAPKVPTLADDIAAKDDPVEPVGSPNAPEKEPVVQALVPDPNEDGGLAEVQESLEPDAVSGGALASMLNEQEASQFSVDAVSQADRKAAPARVKKKRRREKRRRRRNRGRRR